jgi:hypothetical protein
MFENVADTLDLLTPSKEEFNPHMTLHHQSPSYHHQPLFANGYDDSSISHQQQPQYLIDYMDFSPTAFQTMQP